MPNLFDQLVLRAEQEPKSIATQGMHRQATFEQLLHYARCVAGKLRHAGVQAGQLAVTSIRGREFDWMVTLALFHEGVITCSDHGHSALPPSVVPDWVLTDRAGYAPGPNTILLDTAWLEAAQREYRPFQQREYASEDSLVRLILTSGTTGRRKAVPLSLGNVLGRARVNLQNRGGRTSIGMMASTTAGDFNNSVMSLMTGATVFGSMSIGDAIATIRRFAIEDVQASPAQVSSMVEELAARNERLDCLKGVRLVGASPSPVLVRRIHAHLTDNIVAMYGCTEVSSMCRVQPGPGVEPGAVGRPLEHASIEVVDEMGRSLPAGQTGAVRARTPYMAREYFKDPQETARSFRDGWFYPGDRGRINADGMLVLAGRDSEVVNTGGQKIDPLPLDRFLLDYPGVDDAAAFEAEDDLGRECVGAAIVAAKGFDFDALRRALHDAFGRGRVPAVFLAVPTIPRNEMGKIMRAALREQFRKSVAAARRAGRAEGTQ